jgi:hypothetical protein
MAGLMGCGIEGQTGPPREISKILIALEQNAILPIEVAE